MKILIAHNYYAEPGGEDAVVQAEKRLLADKGHEVREFCRSNKEILCQSLLRTVFGMIWSFDSSRKMARIIRQFKPDIVHIHNTFMLISPSIYYICQKFHVPVVQTWHNYRLLCPSAVFFRNGQVCEDCLGHTPPWPAVFHGCWRSSRLGTLAIVLMLTLHRILKTWQKQIDVHIALSEFSGKKLASAGLDSAAVIIKPNFVVDDNPRGSEKSDACSKNYALFIGRISPEKGIETLLAAWQSLQHIPLQMAGDGPLFEQVQRDINLKFLDRVILLGQKDRNEIFELLRSARFLILPSLCYENLPLVIVEAYALGIPVIVSRLGALAEIVSDGMTGLLFNPGDPSDLAAKATWAWQHCREMEKMGLNARKVYVERYAKEVNYRTLMKIYSIATKKQKALSH